MQQQRLPVVAGSAGSGRNGSSNKCLSNDSMHSSSGVSSTGSLHLSIGSEWEESTASTGTVVTATHIYRNLSSSKDEDGKHPLVHAHWGRSTFLNKQDQRNL